MVEDRDRLPDLPALVRGPTARIGDLPGIKARLDYLARLGVDVIWSTPPIYPSPQDDNGYDISDYQDVEPVFGTLEDFDRLLAAVHARDEGGDGPRGFQLHLHVGAAPVVPESRSSRDNPKRDWYWWRDQPNDWRSYFSGPTWALDERTGQYYLHLFATSMPDLNWENPRSARRSTR